MDTRVSLQFLGGLATGHNLTKSCSLLQIEQRKNISRFFNDYGFYQGGSYEKRMFENFRILGQIKPESLNGIILTHAHNDHSGGIPFLVKNKFHGSIYCTEPTASILPITLMDSAKIQANIHRSKRNKRIDSVALSPSQKWLGKHDRAKNKAKLQREKNILNQPLYNFEHVEQTIPLIKKGGFEYEEWVKLAHGVELKFYPSGHVLGGAICVFRIAKQKGSLHIGFSGDLGRKNGIILPPPKIVEEPLDYWVTESTYGGKTHPAIEEEMEILFDLIREAAAEGKTMIIPSYALEKTQEIIYVICKHIARGDIPNIPIYLDAPLATKITESHSLFWRSPGLFKGQEELYFNPFSLEENKMLRAVTSMEASNELINARGAKIVISGSGSCDEGRVRGHLRARLGDKNAIICIVGYMPEESLGRKLKDKLPIVRMNGQEIIVKAKIISSDGFSAHADSPCLNQYAKSICEKNKCNFKKVFIVHGEDRSATNLKIELMKTLNLGLNDIVIPGMGEIFPL